MKLCFLAEIDSPHSKRWISYFSAVGHEVYWISLRPQHEDRSASDMKGNVSVYLLRTLRWKPLTILWNILVVYVLLRKIRPDVFHVHYAGVNGAIGACSMFHPLVVTAWGSDVLEVPKSSLLRKVIRFVVQKADMLTCDAGHVEDALEELGVQRKKIHRINFGVETAWFAPGARDEDLARKLGLEGKQAVISMRRLESLYDIATLLQAAPLVLRQYPDTVFLVGGDGSEAPRLKELARDLGIQDAVRFIGWVSHDMLPSYLRLADAYVSTAISDAGIAASTAEAMSCQIPSIMTASAENAQWIEQGVNGFLFPISDQAVLAEQICRLLGDASLRSAMGVVGRKTMEERNSYENEMKKMEGLYRTISIT